MQASGRVGRKALAMSWITIKSDSIKADADEYVYKMEPHNTKAMKGLPWPCCKRCGLLFLKNDRTRLAVSLGCRYNLSPRFKKVVRS